MRTAADLARLLRELRRRHARRLGRAEPSYRELAEATGWSHGIIGEYLAGRVLPPTDRFDALVRLLGASPAEQGALATARDRVEEARRLVRRSAAKPDDGAVVGAHDGAVDGGVAGESAMPGIPIPRQLPMDVFGFTGRSRELAALDALAFAQSEERARAVVVSAVSGTAGVGKTALAVHWAHRVAGRFPDGQLYLDLRGYGPEPPVEPLDALARLLRGLGVGGPQLPAEPADRAALYRTLLAGRRILVVLDNAATAEQARPLLPGAPSCFVIVTSRDGLAGLVAREGARRIGLDPLTTDEAVALLRTLIGARIDAGAGPPELAELAERCSRLPLALRIAAELASTGLGRDWTELLAGLRDEQRRLDLLDVAGDPRTAVRSVLSWSYKRLTEPDARAFALVGLHPSREFDAYALAALADVDLRQARALISGLARVHLVEPTGGNAFAMHDLLRAYAAECAEDACSPEERQLALCRLFDYYLGTAAAAMDTLFPHDRRSRPDPGPPRGPRPPVEDAREAARWLEQWRGALVAAGIQAARHGSPQHCVDLSRVLWRAFEVGGHHQEALTLHRAAAAASAEGESGRAAALANLGGIHWWLGEHSAARSYFEQALAGHRDAGDRDGEARALARLGLVHERLGHYRAAAEHMRQALESYRASRDRHGEGAQLLNLGALRRRLGDREQAERGLRQAAEIFVELNDLRLEGYALGNLALVLSETGRHAEALAHLERSLELCRRTGDRGGEGSALSTIGAVHGRAGHHEPALEYLHRGLAVSRETGDRSLETETLNALGETLLAVDQPDSALARHRAAMELAECNGDRFEQARALCGVAAVLDGCGRSAEGGEYRARAREIRAQLGIQGG